MIGEPKAPADVRNVSNEERLRSEFARPVPPENIVLIEKALFQVQPSQASAGEIGWQVFGEDPGRWNQTDKFKAAVAKGEITERGKFFQSLIQNRDFIDLGCGDPDISDVPQTVAKALGAKRYIGVDKFSLEEFDPKFAASPVMNQRGYALKDSLGPTHTAIDGGFESSWIQDDMLGFVSKIKDTNGVVFFLAGIEEYDPEPEDLQNAIKYFDALGKELNRVTHTGDTVIFSGVAPTVYVHEKIGEHGFRQMKKEELQKIGFGMSVPLVFARE